MYYIYKKVFYEKYRDKRRALRMITLLSNSGLGVCEYSITKIEELNEIDKNLYAF